MSKSAYILLLSGCVGLAIYLAILFYITPEYLHFMQTYPTSQLRYDPRLLWFAIPIFSIGYLIFSIIYKLSLYFTIFLTVIPLSFWFAIMIWGNQFFAQHDIPIKILYDDFPQFFFLFTLIIAVFILWKNHFHIRLRSDNKIHELIQKKYQKILEQRKLSKNKKRDHNLPN